MVGCATVFKIPFLTFLDCLGLQTAFMIAPFFMSTSQTNLACFFSLCIPHQMSEIKNELETLPMRAMLAAAFITYLSAAPEDRRKQCLDKWTAQSGLQSKYTANTQVYASSRSNNLPKHTATHILAQSFTFPC